MKKILILYAKYGGGHFSAAKALATYIENNYPDAEVKTVDCVEYVSPLISTLTTNGYKQLARNIPYIWGKIYSKSEQGILLNVSSKTQNFMSLKLAELYKNFLPDIVISTHPFASQITAHLKEKGKITCKLATVFTDFAIHKQWLIGKEFCDYFFVSNKKMKADLILKEKINENKIFITGVPLSDRFLSNFNKNKIYTQHGLEPNLKTILFFGGGEFGLGHKRTVDLLTCLTKYLTTYQIIAISGKNSKMNKAFMNIAKKVNNSRLHVYKYSDQVPELMSISSLVITKPGGLTSSESLASGLPLLIINPIPGQEEENAEFLENSGAAVWLKKDDDIDEILNTVLLNEDKLQKMGQNSSMLAHKYSTSEICNIVMNLTF